MSRQNLEPKDVWMQMTSMIDIVFLLLVFFLLVNDMQNMQVEALTLPLAYKATDDGHPEPGRIVINVTPTGEIRINAEPYGRAKLENFLAAEAVKRTGPDGLSTLAVKVRADSNCQYKYVQEVMMACMKAKVWKLSFGVSPQDVGRTAAARTE